ncbi:MAG: hypothetical protein FJW34_15570 [Acidobacteria bacterium]|nr:hypothetical protein [Acidobacteriota bacterium]
MVDLVSEAVRLEAFLQSRGWRYCFIGGLAVQHWGEPRLTRDLDLSLLTGFGGEASYVDALLSVYAPRIEAARDFALARRVLLLKSEGGIGIDISLAALPYEELVVSRAVPVEMLPGSTVRLCSPEDLIIMKMFAGRDTDLRDVRSVIVRQEARGLDWGHIEAHLALLAEAKQDPTLLPRLRDIRKTVTHC